MTKFNEKSLHSFPLAFYFSAMQAFDARIAVVSTELVRFLEMRAELHRLFLAFDDAYTISLKSQTTKTVGDLDKIRDKIAFVMERVANLWESKLDFDDTLNIHGRRVSQVFKDYNFRPEEAIVAENAKIHNMEQAFSGTELTSDLAAMGLTELNSRLASLTTQIEQLVSQRNEEQSFIVVGELKAAREALDAQYHAFLTYLNAVQELQPEEGISLAAQFYNQDLQKIEQQLAQSHKGGTVSQKPENGDTSTDSGNNEPGDTENGGGTGTVTPDPGTGGDNGGGSGTTDPETPDNPGGDNGGSGDNGGGSEID